MPDLILKVVYYFLSGKAVRDPNHNAAALDSPDDISKKLVPQLIQQGDLRLHPSHTSEIAFLQQGNRNEPDSLRYAYLGIVPINPNGSCYLTGMYHDCFTAVCRTASFYKGHEKDMTPHSQLPLPNSAMDKMLAAYILANKDSDEEARPYPLILVVSGVRRHEQPMKSMAELLIEGANAEIANWAGKREITDIPTISPQEVAIKPTPDKKSL
jgi:hypothetical protein